jgi:hypothetical protein
MSMLNMRTSESEIVKLIGKHGENLEMIASQLAARQYGDDEDEEDESSISAARSMFGQPFGGGGSNFGGFGGGAGGGFSLN